jgi:hypothetical protein
LFHKRYTLPTLLLFQGEGRIFFSDNGVLGYLEWWWLGVVGVNLQFPLWERYGFFLECPLSYKITVKQIKTKIFLLVWSGEAT